MSDNTPTTERVRNLYSWAYAWRITDDIEDGEADLSQLRVTQRAEFDRWLAAHDREVAARAWDELYATQFDGAVGVNPVDLHDPRNPYRADQDGADRG